MCQHVLPGTSRSRGHIASSHACFFQPCTLLLRALSSSALASMLRTAMRTTTACEGARGHHCQFPHLTALTLNSSSFFFLRSHLAPVDFTWAASASAHAAAFFAVSRPPRLPPPGSALLLCPYRRGAGGRVRIPSLRAKSFTLSRHPQSLRPQRALSRSRFIADTALKAALRVGSANAPTPSCVRSLPEAAPRVGRSKRHASLLARRVVCVSRMTCACSRSYLLSFFP